ncbi:MAG: sel1 repeat family protein [Planctomycetes bacterium]|nr:sel1 repeat family protein [Planctomycetota bacterium]
MDQIKKERHAIRVKENPGLFARAEKGDVKAIRALAYRYRKGEYLPKDLQKSIELYKKSAKGGYYKAQGDLGFMYSRGEGVTRDYVEAYAWMSASIKNGPESWKKSFTFKRSGVEKRLSEDELARAILLAEKYCKYKLAP